MRYVLALVLVAPLALPFLTAAQNQPLAFEVASIKASRLGRTVDARLAISWAFNIPRGWWGQWQHLSPALFTYLHFFQMLTLAFFAHCHRIRRVLYVNSRSIRGDIRDNRILGGSAKTRQLIL